MRIVTWNTNGGFGDHRAEHQAALIDGLWADVVCLQECGGLKDKGLERLLWLERELGGMRAFLAPAPMVDCHLVTLIAPWLRAVRFSDEYTPVMWHALSELGLEAIGPDPHTDGLSADERGPVGFTVVNAHLSPAAGEYRLAEAGTLTMVANQGPARRSGLSIIAGDLNFASENPVDWSELEFAQRERRTLLEDPSQTDDRPARRLREAGFFDAGWGEHAPTAETRRIDYFWLSQRFEGALSGYRVIEDIAGPDGEPLSDHRPVVVELDLARLSARG